MSLCEYCNKQSKFLFICSHCGKRFCKEHRYPENHECSDVTNVIGAIEEIKPQSDSDVDDQNAQLVEEGPSELEILFLESDAVTDQIDQVDTNTETSVEKKYSIKDKNDISTENSSKEPGPNKENEIFNVFTQLSEHKTPLAIIIIVTLITGALTGFLIYPPDDTENLQQRYDALFEYYTELQSQNQAINQNLENITHEISRLENELLDTQQELSSLQEDWDNIFSDQIQYVKPTVNQLRAWLAEDQTDQQTLHREHTPLHQALQLSLKAKTQGWKLGVITVYGNYTYRLNNYTYNVIKIDGGLFEDACLYLDPQIDQVWWNSNYEKIAPGQVWSLGEYSSVYVSKIETILEP